MSGYRVALQIADSEEPVVTSPTRRQPMVELSLYIPLPSFSLLPFPLLLSSSFLLSPSSPPPFSLLLPGEDIGRKRRLVRRPLGGTLTGVCSFLSGRKARFSVYYQQ